MNYWNNIIFIAFIAIFSTCASTNKTIKSSSEAYLIKNIERGISWYTIYAMRHDSIFMIVSKREDIVSSKWEKIKVGKSYILVLRSIYPVINGVKMIPMNYLDIAGIVLDAKTIVNINPEKGIYDIYTSSSLKGLFLVK